MARDASTWRADLRRSTRTPVRSRLMLFELDSVRQARRLGPLWDTGSAASGVGQESLADAVADIIGMIRTSLMIADRLLVTDSMILDGAFFALMPPAQLAESLGCSVHELPLRVLCQEPSLGASLEKKRSNPTFRWQLSSLLDAEGLKRHWTAWTAPGLPLRIERYGELGQPAREGGFIASEPPEQLTRQIRRMLDTPPADATGVDANAVLRLLDHLVGLRSRSRVEAACATACAEASPSTCTAIERARRWWESEYLRQVAESNGADWLHFPAPGKQPGATDVPAESTAPLSPEHGQRRRIRVSGELKRTLSAVPPAFFAIMRFKVADEREALRRSPSNRRMNDLTYALTHLVEKKSRPVEFGASAGRLLLAAIAIAAAIPDLPGELFGLNVAWLAFALAAIATIPFSDVRALAGTLRRQSVAELSIETEGR